MAASPAAPSDFDALSPAQAAAWYAERHLPVFPCDGKRPLTPHGFKDASTDAKIISSRWKRWPRANIGIPTGSASGWLVIDIDPRNGGNETLEELVAKYGGLPETLEAVTGGGGRHIVFKHVDGLRCGELGPGIDVKADGGYIIVSPSTHPDTKRRYSWDSADAFPRLDAVAEAPDWLLRLLREKQTRSSAASSSAQGAKIPAGRRNVELTSIAGVLRSRGAGEADLRELLRAINARLCERPLPDEEVDNIARSVARYDPRVNADRPDAQRIFEVVDEGRYRLSVPGICAELEVDRLRRDGGELVCELTVRCWLPGARGVDGVLSVADFNLSSARARLDRAKLLAARAGTKAEEVDWPGIVEELAQRVLTAQRSVEAIELCEVPLPEAEDLWVEVDGFRLLKHHPNMIFSLGGGAKSYLGVYIAARLAMAGERVLYIDTEADSATHRLRLHRLFGQKQIFGLLYYRAYQPLNEAVDGLRRLIADRRVTFVIVDSVSCAADGPLEESATATRLFQALRRFNCGSLLMAHTQKGGEAKDKTPFGSVFFLNLSRRVWAAEKIDDTGDTFVVKLRCSKSNFGGEGTVFCWRFIFTGRDEEPDARTEIFPVNPAEVEEAAADLPLHERIAMLLRKGAMTRDEIADELEASPDSVRRVINRNKDRFLVLQGGRVALRDRDGGAAE